MPDSLQNGVNKKTIKAGDLIFKKLLQAKLNRPNLNHICSQRNNWSLKQQKVGQTGPVEKIPTHS